MMQCWASIISLISQWRGSSLDPQGLDMQLWFEYRYHKTRKRSDKVMERGREIINLGGTTLCLCTLLYVCVSGNSTGLMLGNYTSPPAKASQQQEQRPQSSKPPSSTTCSFVMILQAAVMSLSGCLSHLIM